MGKISDKRMIPYLEKVKKSPDAKILLFGSRARNDALIESDHDLCIISEKFKGMDLCKRPESLHTLMIKDPINAECVSLTPEEFTRLTKTLTIYSDIKKYGVPI